MKIILSFFIFLFTTFVQAQILLPSGMTHGGELEFTSDEIYDVADPNRPGQPRGREEPAAYAMSEIVKRKCQMGKCKVELREGKWGPENRFIMPDGWWFQISWDPYCVEIQTKPSTLQTLYKQETLMQDMIFESAKEAGLEPRDNHANHINTGIRSAFGKDVMAFFKFFVDNSNHPELASGILRRNWKSSPPLTAYGYDSTQLIEAIYRKIESGQIRTFKDLAFHIESGIYLEIPHHPDFSKSRSQDLNILKLKEVESSPVDLPFERRGSRAARSFHEFILQAELQEARIQWSKKQKGRIPFIFTDARQLTNETMHSRFTNWLAEMNLNPNRYMILVPDEIKMSCKRVAGP